MFDLAITTALDLDQYPNAPYCTSQIQNVLRRRLNRYSPQLEVKEDHLALYARFNNGTAQTKLLIDTHIDHPGFVIQDLSFAKAIGSIGTPGIFPLIGKELPFPVAIHDPNGSKVGDGILSDLSYQQSNLYAKVIAEGTELSPNGQIVLSLQTGIFGNELWMRSADNQAVTAVSLAMIEWLCQTNPVADVIFVFTKLEEIKQVSATLIARRGYTPFGIIDDNTNIIVLEAASVGFTNETKQIINCRPSYTDGPVIRVADNELVYLVNGRPNLSESLVLHAADISMSQIQHAPLISNCNATAYTLFGKCPNIISLTIPCRNKHNITEKGKIVPEKVYCKDIAIVINLLKESVTLAKETISVHRNCIINNNTKYPGDSVSNYRIKRKDWLRTAIWAESRLKANHLFPVSQGENVKFKLHSIKARLDSQLA